MINPFKSGSNGRKKRLRKTRRNFWRADRPGKIDVQRAVGVLNNLIPRLAHSCKAVRVSTAHHHTLQFDQLPPHGGTLPVWCGWWHRNSFHHGHFFFFHFFFLYSLLVFCGRRLMKGCVRSVRAAAPPSAAHVHVQPDACSLPYPTIASSAPQYPTLAVPNNRLSGLSPSLGSFALYAD